MSEPFDLDALMQQAMAMQRQLADAQDQAATTEVEGRAGGGSVSITMTGTGEVTAVRIAPEVVDPDDVELLEDLVLAALRDAGQRVADLQADALGGGLGNLAEMSGLAGLGLGDAFGLSALAGPDDDVRPGLAPGDDPPRA